MRFSRHSRIVTALIALFSVLFMQLAVAAYACPTVEKSPSMDAHAGWTSADSHDSMPGCEGGVDVDQPALCFAFSQEGSQSLYKPPVPDVQPAIVTAIVRIISAPELDFRPAPPVAQAPWLMRASDPPLSIRNCCFRI
ncbi:MAG TPA: hypothetical protein VEC35_23195 [Noviherbaspirillum sp.]|nr:hypothetical protein [Noviherbaspirillum sp.]